MFKSKKIMTFLLCAIMSLSVMAGCGEGGGSRGKLTVFYSDLAGLNTAINQRTDLYKKYMQDCGVEFRALTTGGGDSESQLQNMFNLGDLPDVFVHRTAELPKFYAKMIADKAILPISDFVSETKYPNIYNQISKHDYLKANIDFTNGKHYGIPTEFAQEHCLFVRTDWIDNLNKPEKLDDILVDEGYVASKSAITDAIREQHQFKQPNDLIEFYRLARAFTLYDPDENDKHDTYGYTSEKGMYSDNWLYVAGGGFRTMQDIDGDGKYTFSGTTDENKFIVSYINRLLKEGYMDPSWISDDSSHKTTKFGQSKVGMIECQATFNYFVGYFQNLLNCTPTEAAGKMAMIAPPQGRPMPTADGKQMRGIQGHPNFWTSISFSSKMSESKREDAFKLVDYLLSDEGKDLVNLGIEGVHYEKVDDDTLKSKMGKDALGMNKDIYALDNFSIARVFSSITRNYYSPFQTNADKVIEIVQKAETYNNYPDYYMLTTPALTEYWDGLCAKMLVDFATMQRNESLYNTSAHATQKVSAITWSNIVSYTDTFNSMWSEYVSRLNGSYHGTTIENEYNEYVAHGEKAVAPDLNYKIYNVVEG